MVDVGKMISDGDASKYVTPRFPRWAWFLLGLILGFLIAGMLCSKAHASPACMTHHEAKQIWPTKYLHWHGEHCWRYGHEHRHVEHHEVERVPLPIERPDFPAQEWIYAERWWVS